MHLCGPVLRVSLVTTHPPLARVPSLVTYDRVSRCLELTWNHVRRLGVADKPIAVCGLNPHAGEHGLLGTEDETVVRPAVEAAVGKGIAAVGPLPADTVFYRTAKGEFSAILAMYHDQGLPPLKLLHFRETVNVTLGLPFIRTSVGHGTGFDLVGTDRASTASLAAALDMGKRDEALLAYSKAEKGAKLFLEPLKKIADLYHDEGNYTEELRILQRLDKLSPLNVDRKMRIGADYVQIGDKEKAKASFDRAIRLATKEALNTVSRITQAIAAMLITACSPQTDGFAQAHRAAEIGLAQTALLGAASRHFLIGKKAASAGPQEQGALRRAHEVPASHTGHTHRAGGFLLVGTPEGRGSRHVLVHGIPEPLGLHGDPVHAGLPAVHADHCLPPSGWLEEERISFPALVNSTTVPAGDHSRSTRRRKASTQSAKRATCPSSAGRSRPGSRA